MAGLLDFLFQGQGGQGGGLLGGMYGQQGGQQMGPDGMPMQISPGPQQQGLNVPNLPQPGMTPQNQNPGMAGSLDPSFFANQVRQNQQPPGMLFNADSGMLGGLRGALNQISDPQGQRQQQAIQNYLAVKAAEEKPQYQVVEDPNSGVKRLVQISPFGRGATYVNPREPGAAGGGAPPQPPPGAVPGADLHTMREATAKAAVANQEDSVKSAKAAADIQPLLDEMHSAYENAIKLGATGPVSASSPGRYLATGLAAAGDATGLGNQGNWKEAESARQRYDIAKAAVQARITAAQNKGEGSVSNYERSLYAAQFPELTAIDPETQIKNLRQIRDQNRQTMEAGKIPALGQAPQVGAVLNRPSVSGAPAAPAAPAIAPQSAAPQAPPMRVTSVAQAMALPSGTRFIDPNGVPRTRP